MSKCIVYGAGEFEKTGLLLEEGDLCIAADGGFYHCLENGMMPNLILGDFDSVNVMEREEIELFSKKNECELLTLPIEKDDTDMLFAIRKGLERGYKEFYLLGALGGRLDHTLANMQCLKFLKDHDAQGYIMTPTQVITLLQDEGMRFPEGMKAGLSVFCIGDKAEGVTIRGAKYEIENAELTNAFPIGVSNEILGKSVEIAVKKGAILVMISYQSRL